MAPISSIPFLFALFLHSVCAYKGILAVCRTDKSLVLGQFVKETVLVNDSLRVLQNSGYRNGATFDHDAFVNGVESLKLPPKLEGPLLTNLNDHIIKDSSLFATSLIGILQKRCHDLNNEYSSEPANIPLEVYSSASYRTDKVLKLIPKSSSNLVIVCFFSLVILLEIGAFYYVFIKKDYQESLSI